VCVIKARLVREGSRLLTVVGRGGVKIRLALEGAAALAQRYTDGVCFVSLADTTTADETAATVLRRLILPLAGSTDAPTSLFAPCARASSCSTTLNTWCIRLT